MARSGRAFVPAALAGVPRSSQSAIAAGQTLQALKRFCYNRFQRPALPFQEIQGVGQSLWKRKYRGTLMPEESLGTALVRSDVLGCPWGASRPAFSS